MAKEHKHAAAICSGLTLLAIIGIVLGILLKNPMPVVILLLPVVGYEIYRTEGFYTKLASAGILAILIIELIVIIGGFTIDLAGFLGERLRFGRYRIPLGDVKIVGPAIIAFLSMMLFRRTGGIYTRWLAVVILITAVAMIYVLNPNLVTQLFDKGVSEGIKHLR